MDQSHAFTRSFALGLIALTAALFICMAFAPAPSLFAG